MHGGDGDALEGRAVQRTACDDFIIFDEHGGEVHAFVVIQTTQAQKRPKLFQGLAAHGSPGPKMHAHTSTPILWFEYSRAQGKSKEIIVVKNRILLYNIRGMI